MNKLPQSEFDFDFIEITLEEDIELVIVDVRNELILDCIDMKVIEQENNFEGNIGYVFSYISKYAYFIYHFEKNEAYEYCAEVRKHFLAVICDTFQIGNEEVDSLIAQSINNFREKQL